MKEEMCFDKLSMNEEACFCQVKNHIYLIMY